ncbi:MAG TPA: hypothetical protein VGR26_00375 [Acidimicrobiales bacterium]|nr:hypothetical protein [Acidimicrobiales bacterium]
MADQQRTIEMLKADGGHLVATRHPQRGVQPVAEEDLAKGESIGVMAPW